MTVYNCSNRADREKDKPIYRFISTVKNNIKEDLQILKKDLTVRKLERTKMKIMLSASSSSVFSLKAHYIRFVKEVRILSLLTIIKLESPVSVSSN